MIRNKPRHPVWKAVDVVFMSVGSGLLLFVTVTFILVNVAHMSQSPSVIIGGIIGVVAALVAALLESSIP